MLRPTTSIGSRITPILKACGISLQGLKPIAGDRRLDLSYLGDIVYIKGVVKATEQLMYQLDDNKVFLLPNKDLPSIKFGNPGFHPTLNKLHQYVDKNSLSIARWKKKRKRSTVPCSNKESATPSAPRKKKRKRIMFNTMNKEIKSFYRKGYCGRNLI